MGPYENLDRGDHFGTTFVPKTHKTRHVIGWGNGKVDFPKSQRIVGHVRVLPLIETHSRG